MNSCVNFIQIGRMLDYRSLHRYRLTKTLLSLSIVNVSSGVKKARMSSGGHAGRTRVGLCSQLLILSAGRSFAVCTSHERYTCVLGDGLNFTPERFRVMFEGKNYSSILLSRASGYIYMLIVAVVEPSTKTLITPLKVLT